MSGVPARVEGLSESRRALLARQLRRAAVAGPGQAGIRRRPAGMDRVPLSFAQEQLWFLAQLAPGTPTYNVPLAARLDGPCDRTALQRALEVLVARHESLRTTFPSVDGRPWQVIGAPNPVELGLTDLTELPAGQRDAELARVAAAQGQRPFQLDRGPLLLTHLVRLGETSHVLVITVHHIVFDGWSSGVFLRELGALYDEFATGAEAGLAESELQYADYAVWQRQQLEGDRLTRLVDYWTHTLEGVPTLELPTDRPRPAIQSFAGANESLEIPGSLAGALRELSRKQGATLFMTLLAGFAVLLSRYSGQDDIVVGTPAANRGRTELEPVIGYFVNMLAIRVDLSGDPSFIELLSRVRQATMGAYVHQDLPFATLVDALRLERDPSRSPLFQTGFTVQESRDTAFSSTLRIEVDDVPTGTAKTDLSLFVSESSDSLGLGMEFAAGLFERATVWRMLAHLRVLLVGVTADPGQRLSQLPLLTPQERHRQLVEWNDTAAPAPVQCVHELFEAQAVARPEATAAVLADQRISYRELDRQANQVARYLQRLGVGPEVLVGVCAQRSLRRLAGILGVLKAGGAYLPLDPAYPAERLAFMMEDSAVPVVLAEAATAGAVAGQQATVVRLDTDWEAITAGDDTGLPRQAGTHNLAYVIYTSGSTGQPKGVMVEHRSVANYAVSAARALGVGPGERVLQFASLSFDASVFEMFAALACGATVCLGSEETLRSPGRLAQLLRDRRITVALLTPGVATVLAAEAATFADLRTIVLGGEAFSSELVRAWARPGRQVVNGYGPTEATVAVVVGECRGDEPAPPIGRPLANQQVYVLDRQLNPVPVGVPGQLYLGGIGLARGYVNRPELTAERFIPNPFAGDLAAPGARLYATGDLARWLPDGNLVLLGRTDHQVKIRGYRVELGEIETVLAAHPGVAQVVVIAREDVPGYKQLVGYVTAEAAEVLNPAGLRRHLEARLPAYMVPAHIVVLDALPLTASGKLDRNGLPAPAPVSSSGTQAPRTLVETLLADVFAEVLGVEAVGSDDSFFDLGGNSLQAMRLLARLRDTLAVEADVTLIFQSPTVATLAEALRTGHGLSDESLDSDGRLAELEHLSDEEVAVLLASLEETEG
ncbi:MAG: non-ribosomal peptide synthetase [Pseudonocardiaceae bacterium]